jgi:hypothetical protein
MSLAATVSAGGGEEGGRQLDKGLKRAGGRQGRVRLEVRRNGR